MQLLADQMFVHNLHATRSSRDLRTKAEWSVRGVTLMTSLWLGETKVTTGTCGCLRVSHVVGPPPFGF